MHEQETLKILVLALETKPGMELHGDRTVFGITYLLTYLLYGTGYYLKS
jgi:hypothetical protein